MNSEIESLIRAYNRLSRDVGGRINFACDLNNDDALKVAEQEKEHLDQAFFVLSFAALENQVTSLASANLTDGNCRAFMREAKFEQRWDAAAKVAETTGTAIPWGKDRSIVLSWYKIWSDIAHGRSPSLLADIVPILTTANQIAATFDDVRRSLNAQ